MSPQTAASWQVVVSAISDSWLAPPGVDIERSPIFHAPSAYGKEVSAGNLSETSFPFESFFVSVEEEIGGRLGVRFYLVVVEDVAHVSKSLGKPVSTTFSILTYTPKYGVTVTGFVKFEEGNPEIFLNGTVPEGAQMLSVSEVCNLLNLLSSGFVTTYTVCEPNGANKRRVAKGKKPLFDWRTVEIAPRLKSSPTNNTEPTGIKHRQHDVRGHMRHYKSGKAVFVKAHKRGDASLGVIFHDYNITNALAYNTNHQHKE